MKYLQIHNTKCYKDIELRKQVNNNKSISNKAFHCNSDADTINQLPITVSMPKYYQLGTRW